MADLWRLALDSRLLVSNLRLIDPKLFKPEPLPAGTTSAKRRWRRRTCPASSGPPRSRSPASPTTPRPTARIGPLAQRRERAARSSRRRSDAARRRHRRAQRPGALRPERRRLRPHVVFRRARPPGRPGRRDRPRPRGPAAVIDVWGERLVAFGWRIVVRRDAHRRRVGPRRGRRAAPAVAITATPRAASPCCRSHATRWTARARQLQP